MQVKAFVFQYGEDFTIELPIKIGSWAKPKPTTSLRRSRVHPVKDLGSNSVEYNHPVASIRAVLRTLLFSYAPGQMIDVELDAINESGCDIIFETTLEMVII